MLEDLSLFAMAQRSMDWSARRQSVLSENVANANTPKYQAKDLEPVNFKDLMAPQEEPLRAVMTNPMHMSPEALPVNFKTVTEGNPSESSPDGNSVSLDEQMQKVGDAKGTYELAVNLFMAHVNMLKTAIGKGS